MRHVRIIIDEAEWYNGVPEDLNIQQTEGSLTVKVGAKRQSLEGLFGRRPAARIPARRSADDMVPDVVPPVIPPDERTDVVNGQRSPS
jgi:hypothetical protein